MGKGRRTGLLASLRKVNAAANRYAGPIFLAGIAGAAFYQRRLWQQDKKKLARRKEKPALPPLESWPDLPKVTALVAAWNEAAHIEQHIQSFLALRYPNKELVLVAGGVDKTFELAQGYAGELVIVLKQQLGQGKQRALRCGFDFTGGDIIYLTDADCRLDNESFEQVIWPIVSESEMATTGSSKPFASDLANPFVASQAATQIYTALHTPEYAPGMLGRNCAVKRRSLIESRGLDLHALTGTDYVLAKALDRSGVRIRQITESRVQSEYPLSPKAYLLQQRRWISNVWRQGRRFRAAGEARASVFNASTGLLMLALPAAGLLVGPWLLAAWAVLLLYGSLNRVRYAKAAHRLANIPKSPADWMRSPIYLTLDCLAWAGAIPAFFRKQGRWE